MNRWVTTIIESNAADSVKKAKADVCDIAKGMDYQPLYIYRYIDENEDDYALTSRIDGITAGVANQDMVVYQYPSYNGAHFDRMFLQRMKQRGIYTILFIHDAEMLRGKVDFDEAALFNEATLLIVHSQAMQTALVERGVTRKMVQKPFFDYRHKEVSVSHERPEKRVVFAGNLAKTLFLQQWPNRTEILVYGEKNDRPFGANVHYCGVFEQEELIRKMEKNGFGLAWDDKLPAGGDYQQYTKYNAPHKISLYLSLGIPVIVWQQAAIAEMVQKLGLGIIIAGIEEIDHKLGELTDEEMLRMKNNVLSFSCLLRSGIFTRTALVDSEVKILLNKGANQE
ncbi:hypothetical protein [Enterococcus gallinarum]|uniref:hypothetical protein n=1 Tax=Enterococcus gallinarum TaxID=1353 RepID=UPI001BD8733C|nr:hypothetical protein [Enterococcus gallinarum]MBR8696891.1 hypothetical protein [Enterococcus gallinarum]MBW5474547.1 hypothetical protein [Enterococcus gallinarum]UJA23133.1 hypothetical protein HED61_05950 [Enterococcus gallinarum]